MRISARADYAVRAALQLAAAQDAGPLKAEAIAVDQDISHKFLEGILGDMRKGGLVQSQRGGNGGYWLARPAESISVADVIRCVDGPSGLGARGAPAGAVVHGARRVAAHAVDRAAGERPRCARGVPRGARGGEAAGGDRRARGRPRGVDQPLTDRVKLPSPART
ncbi:Rrf2 family transcriptional regulator [Streptomyces tanashiensis]